MTDGESILGLVPLVVGAGITIAAMKYFFPEGSKPFSTEKPRSFSVLEAAGV